MLSTIKEVKAMAQQWNALTSDLARLEFLKKNNGNMHVVLDNDLTSVVFNKEGFEEEVEEIIYEIEAGLKDFDNYHGYGDGNVLLFKFAGIDAETV